MPGVGQSYASARAANKTRALRAYQGRKKKVKRAPVAGPTPPSRARQNVEPSHRTSPSHATPRNRPIPRGGHHRTVPPTTMLPHISLRDLLRITGWKPPKPATVDPPLPPSFWDQRLYGPSVRRSAPLSHKLRITPLRVAPRRRMKNSNLRNA